MKNNLAPLAFCAFLSTGVMADSTTEAWLIQTANQTNHYLPMTADGMGMRWDRVMAGPGLRMTYHYTYINLSAGQFNKVTWRAVIEKENLKSCQIQEMIPFFERGVTFTYVYFGNDGGMVGSTDLTPAHCGY